MEQQEVIWSLHEKIIINGEPIEKSEMFMTLSDMNVSDQDVSDYSNSLHNLLKIKGRTEAARKILTIFRINPLVAVRIIESCSLAEDFDDLVYSVKALFSAVRNDSYVNSDLVLLNRNKSPYVALLIEAVYESSFSESNTWQPDMFLEYAQEEDKRLHRNNRKSKYLNEYNIKHILTHIPENCQIEFINWFWDKHCYAAKMYGKSETFAGNRVKIMMRELAEGSLWQHLENDSKSILSEIEKKRVEKERAEIQKFIRSVISEGRHTQYVKTVIGRANFYDKLQALMGDDFITEYDKSVENQRLVEKEEERIFREREEEKKSIISH